MSESMLLAEPGIEALFKGVHSHEENAFDRILADGLPKILTFKLIGRGRDHFIGIIV